jgi:hypothetical protein
MTAQLVTDALVMAHCRGRCRPTWAIPNSSRGTAAVNMNQQVTSVAPWPLPEPVKEIQRGVAQ